MRSFKIEEQFSVNVLEFFELIYKDSTFKLNFLKQRGDQDIEVTDWIVQNENSSQRICFYSMKDNADEKQEYTRCLETERFEWVNSKENTEKELHIYCSITPESNAIFKIFASWKITNISSSECKVSGEGVVECTKKVWGLQGIAEGFLEKQATTSMNKWLEICRIFVIELNKKKEKEKEENRQLNRNSNSPVRQIRMRAMKEIRTVVSGTEKLVNMLSEVAPWRESEEDPSTIHGDEAVGCLPAIVIETGVSMHPHSDEDLTRNQNVLFPTYGYVLIAIAIAILLIYSYMSFSFVVL